MRYREDALALIRESEGLKLRAYRDPAGILTVGYGHTGPDVFYGMEITEAQAGTMLEHDFKAAEEAMNSLVRVPLTDGMRSALIDFVYNLGSSKLRGSTMLRYINAREYRAAKDQFAQWSYGGGRQLLGLVRRRHAETLLWERDGYEPKDVA